jgi:hypothetical protein
MDWTNSLKMQDKVGRKQDAEDQEMLMRTVGQGKPRKDAKGLK